MKRLIIAAFAALFTIAFSGAFATSAVTAYDQVAATWTDAEQGTHPMDSDKQQATDEEKQTEEKDGEKKSD